MFVHYLTIIIRYMTVCAISLIHMLALFFGILIAMLAYAILANCAYSLSN